MHTISIKLCLDGNFLNAINWDFGGKECGFGGGQTGSLFGVKIIRIWLIGPDNGSLFQLKGGFTRQRLQVSAGRPVRAALTMAAMMGRAWKLLYCSHSHSECLPDKTVQVVSLRNFSPLHHSVYRHSHRPRFPFSLLGRSPVLGNRTEKRQFAQISETPRKNEPNDVQISLSRQWDHSLAASRFPATTIIHFHFSYSFFKAPRSWNIADPWTRTTCASNVRHTRERRAIDCFCARCVRIQQ